MAASCVRLALRVLHATLPRQEGTRPRGAKLAQVSLSIGIVGLPNVGKSTVFNALTRAGALASSYAFATIEPNVGVVGVPDPRLAELAKLYDSAKIIPASVRFIDIAGLVRGASQGQGLGNQFLAHIRETDAICQVVRLFADPDVSHVDGDVSPERDIETVVTELILADLQTLEKALPRLVKEAKSASGFSARAQVVEAATAAQELLFEEIPLSTGAASHGIDLAALRELQLLTAKPFLYVFNCDVGEPRDDDELRMRLSAHVAPAEADFLDAKTEADLTELPEEEAAELLAEGRTPWASPGSRPAGPGRLPRARPADLPHRGPAKEPRAPGDQGRSDRPGGGFYVIHSDFQRGFIKAEVVFVLRRPDRPLLPPRRRPRGGQGPHRRQGLHHARRRRGRVQVQRIVPRPLSQGALQLIPGSRVINVPIPSTDPPGLPRRGAAFEQRTEEQPQGQRNQEPGDQADRHPPLSVHVSLPPTERTSLLQKVIYPFLSVSASVSAQRQPGLEALRPGRMPRWRGG